MNTEMYVKSSLTQAIKEAGNMRKLSEKVKVDYSTINRFNSGDNEIGNMPLKTLIKLFPELQIFCFNSDFINSRQPVGDVDVETELLSIFRGLSHDRQLECLVMVAANFGEKIREETRDDKEIKTS